MSVVGFICPDREVISFVDCFQQCRMGPRCAALSYLRLIAEQREFRGVTPSAAGNGPRYIFLHEVTPYYIDPNESAFMALGVSVHGKLAIHRFNQDVLAEEPLQDDRMKGIADALEEDDEVEGAYILQDFKTWGSFKVAKALGVVSEDVPILDDQGQPVLLKSGKNKGKPKTESKFFVDSSKADMRDTELQINRYRMFFNQYGFPISHMLVQAIVRDGGTYVAKSRGITRNLYVIPVKYIQDREVDSYYDHLIHDVECAFWGDIPRICNSWEKWDGRRCKGYCQVVNECKRMGGWETRKGE